MNGETFMNKRIEQVIDELLKENPNAQAAFKAICARGQTERFAKDEVRRALTACLWETWNKDIGNYTGDVHRPDDVFKLLEQGKTTVELWPDAEDEAVHERKHDLEEVATALEQMFEALDSAGEKEPDMDLIVDILDECFPGITVEQLTEVRAIFRARLETKTATKN
jgi:hypothetical protein